MIKIIEDNGIIYGKIIRAAYEAMENEFFSDVNDELQIGYLDYKKDYKSGAHFHNRSYSKINQTDEIVIMQKGSARIDFYNNKGDYIKSFNISKGDIIIIYKAGHNVLFYEDTRALVIKPDAYEKENSKTRIIGANNTELIIDNEDA